MEATPELENQDDVEASERDERVGQTKTEGKGKVKFESAMQRSEAVVYFGALVEGLRHGQLQFRHGNENLSLYPAEHVSVEVKASRKGDRERVAFELEWKRVAEGSSELDG